MRGTKGNILVISTACFSGSWKSTHWTLLAAAGPDQHSISMAVSGSGECRGGFFTNALLAEHADEFNIRPPYPGPIDNSGHRLQQRSHDFGPEKTTSPSPRQPKRSMQDILDWIYRSRNDIGRTYPSADIIFHPCQLGSHRLPFASLISGRAPFHKLACVAPSPSADQASILSANTFPVSPLRNLPSISPRMLSEEEEATLVIWPLTFHVTYHCKRASYHPSMPPNDPWCQTRSRSSQRRNKEQTLFNLDEYGISKGPRPYGRKEFGLGKSSSRVGWICG